MNAPSQPEEPERRPEIVPARNATGAVAYASAEHLQLASSARGVVEGLMTAKPMATAIAILTRVNILVFPFAASHSSLCEFPNSRHPTEVN
jgi:hypothetical protein